MKYFTPTKISENIHETPEGFLVCIGVPIARTGEMVYGEGETPLEVDGGGKVIINREEAEVFRPETLASFEGKPITLGHPVDFVDPNNWSLLAKGTIQNVRRGEGEFKNDLLADLLITDNMAINLVKMGLREVSCGYEAEYVQTEEGKGNQTNIIGNHLALVQQGRAGAAYAINDHKRGFKMKWKERVTAIFAKAQDEALKVVDEDKEDKAKDAEPKKEEEKAKDAEPKEETKAMDAKGMCDELVKICDALSKLKDAMMPKDAASPAAAGSGEKEEKAEDSDLDPKMKEYVDSKMKEMMDSMKPKEDGSESEDADKEEESEDDDFEESSMVGDTASRAEILAPGIKLTKTVKVDALKAAYATKDGQSIINQFTGNKAPDYKSSAAVDSLFIAASELLKVKRSKEMTATRTTDYQPSLAAGPVSPEQMNEISAKFWSNKK